MTTTEEQNNKDYAGGYARGRSGDVVRDVFGLTGGDDQRHKGYADGAKDRDRYGFKPEDECGTGETHDDSCCYITSACLDSMKLPRTSLEMKAMKVLTKDHILKSFSGKRDYIAYGRKAPAIVGAINSRPDSQKIWAQVYNSLKQVAVRVFAGEYVEGHGQYKALVLALENRFVKIA